MLTIVDILVFFAVLITGFAYVWWRGDLDWVRAVGRPPVRGRTERIPPPWPTANGWSRCEPCGAASGRHFGTGIDEQIMDARQLHARLSERFGEDITGSNLEALDPWVEVAPAVWSRSASTSRPIPRCASTC